MRIITKPLSQFEKDHTDALIHLAVYKENHDGELPDWHWVNKMENRQDINPIRFEHYHPNFAELLKPPHSHLPPPPIIPCPPVDCRPIIRPPQDCNPPSVTPEPTSGFLLAIALTTVVIIKRMV